MLGYVRTEQYSPVCSWAFRTLLAAWLWFLVLFAPLMCILHCQVLMQHGTLAVAQNNHEHARIEHGFQPASGEALIVCQLLIDNKSPLLPPMNALPRIVYDIVLPALLLLATSWLLRQGVILQPPMAAQLCLAPGSPPPK